MKFVIDVPEDYIYDGKLRIHDNNVYFPCENHWTNTKIDMRPYNVPVETIQKYEENIALRKNSYQVWEMIRKISCVSENGMDDYDRSEYFGRCNLTDILNLPYDEVHELFDNWWENKHNIHIGDEVLYPDASGRFVVYVIFPDGYLSGAGYKDDDEAASYSYVDPKKVQKTGRYFPEVADVVEKMSKKE